MTRKKLLIITGILVSLTGVSALSQTGRATFSKVIAFISAPKPTAPAVVASTGDVEQRARGKHGWGRQVIVNSVAQGTLTYLDDNGVAISQANLKLYRKYPDRLRIELERNGATDVSGFDQVQAWRSGRSTLSEEEARDIRAFLRMWPERLFTTRGGGARYREAGRRIEDYDPAKNPAIPPPQGTKAGLSVVFDQVEMEDTLGLPPTSARAGDRRLVYYYVNRDNSVVTMAQWLEPDDPRQRLEDPDFAATDMRIDFAGWQEIDGVLWPTEIICKKGGKKFLRIQLSDVKINQSINDTIFQQP
jgi:hypothetical protein